MEKKFKIPVIDAVLSTSADRLTRHHRNSFFFSIHTIIISLPIKIETDFKLQLGFNHRQGINRVLSCRSSVA
jgi:hypothetical protein